MSEKQFTPTDRFRQFGLWCFDEEQNKYLDATSMVLMLNEQQSTIDKLDQENADLLGARIKAQEEWEKCTDKLKKKILEQQATIKSKDKQLERLYNYFQDYLKDEMSGNAFSEMWDFVKEDERWEDE